MDNPQAGWYPDPAGDAAKLRWWDGERWTDDYAPAQQPAQEAAQPQPEQAAQAEAQPQPVQPEGADAGTAAAGGQRAVQPYDPSAPLGTQPLPEQTGYSAAGYQTGYQTGYQASPYAVSDNDRTLRLIAFILNVVSTVASCWLIIPLAWMVPMSVRSWSIYKGTRPNTTAFGVCDLIFVNLIAGILLLASQKEA